MTAGAPPPHRPRRVDQVITKLAVGGAQESVLVTCRELDGARYRQVLLTGPEVDEEGDLFDEARASGVDVVVVPSLVRSVDPRRDVGAVADLARRFRAARPDIVHTHSSKAGIIGRVAAVVAGVPVVVHSVHGWSFHDQMHPAARAVIVAVERIVARWTDVLVVEATTDLEKGLAAGIGRREQYSLIRNGIDLARFTEEPASQADARRAIGVPDDVRLVGTIGRLAPQKHPLAMVEAMAEVVAHRPGTRFAWIGDGPLRAETEARAAELGIGGAFEVLGVRRDVPRALRALDVFALSSLWEGLPRTVTEAMASNVPVVATAVDGLAEAIVPGESGLLVAPDDPPALARAIERVLDDDDLAARLRAGGRDRAWEFDRREMIARLDDLYGGLLPHPLGTRPLRVAHVITGLEVGGAELVLARLLEALDDRSTHRVVSLTTAGPVAERIEAAGVEVVALGMRRDRPSVTALARLVGELRSWSPDLVQTWLYHGDALGGLAGRALRRPVVWNLRMGNIDAAGRRSTNAVARACGPLSRVVPARIVSNSVAAIEFHQQLGYDARRAVVIPNGFDLERFAPDPSARGWLHDLVGRPSTVTLVAVVARLDPQKDHEGFLRALAIVRRQRPDVEAILCGRGCDERSGDLARWATAAGVAGAVHLVGVRDDVPRVLAGADLVVQPSAFGEAFPNAVGEAMACGTPVVATDVGDTAAVLEGVGWVVPPRSPEHLATAMGDALAEDAHHRQDRVARGRARVAERYSLAAAAEAYQRLYDELVADPRRNTNSLQPWRPAQVTNHVSS